tara:strand:- start:351 stop:1253 length:903 start_codon:yes stop_codon:yes gene_type:complete
MKNLLIIASLIGILFSSNRPYVVVLGIAQDGGLPHAGCDKTCCKGLWETNEGEKVSCIGVVDPRTKQSWLIDATPDLPEQLRTLTLDHKTELAGIFLTHAHMGHYVGLLQLGREVMGAKDIPIYAMPRMKSFLENNGPWNQLVELENIKIQSLKEGKELKIGEQLFIEPFLVPHRDEYSETVGFRIMGPEQSLIYIPDIDKWEKWEQNIYKLVMNIDFALIDGTFFSQDELPHRNMDEIPHPFIVESMETLFNLSTPHRNKVHFIHLNHSNPAIKKNSAAENHIRSKRFNIARENHQFSL